MEGGGETKQQRSEVCCVKSAVNYTGFLSTHSAPRLWCPLSTALVEFGCIIVYSLPPLCSLGPPWLQSELQPSGIKYARSPATCGAFASSNQQMPPTLASFLETRWRRTKPRKQTGTLHTDRGQGGGQWMLTTWRYELHTLVIVQLSYLQWRPPPPSYLIISTQAWICSFASWECHLEKWLLHDLYESYIFTANVLDYLHQQTFVFAKPWLTRTTLDYWNLTAFLDIFSTRFNELQKNWFIWQI